jgi:hypothetical protein
VAAVDLSYLLAAAVLAEAAAAAGTAAAAAAGGAAGDEMSNMGKHKVALPTATVVAEQPLRKIWLQQSFIAAATFAGCPCMHALIQR